MSDDSTGQDNLLPFHSSGRRIRRRILAFFIRYSVSIALGASLGLLVSYSVRKIGM